MRQRTTAITVATLRRRRRLLAPAREGFTFVEVLIGITLLLTIALAGLGQLLVTQQLAQTFHIKRLALLGAEAKTEELTKLAVEQYSLLAPQQGATFTVDGLSPNEAQGVVQLCAVSPSMYDVRVKVCMRDGRPGATATPLPPCVPDPCGGGGPEYAMRLVTRLAAHGG